MATASEGLCVENLIWSNIGYSLAEFVEKFQLPQIVRVESGYFVENESTSLTSGQVVRLHCIRKIKKFVCETVSSNNVVIPYAYPVKCLVENSEFSKISALQLSVLSDQVKYVLTLGGYHNLKSPSDSFQEGTILEITGIDTKRKCIQCRNVLTMKIIQVDFHCMVLFCSLRDCSQRTLAEVAEKFELPVKVKLLRQSFEDTIDPNLPSFVSNLREVRVLNVIEQTVVVLTVLGENSKDLCLEITKDIPVYVTVAQEFLENEMTYVRVVKTLDRFEELDIYKNMVIVAKRDKGSSDDYGNADVEDNIAEFRCRKFAFIHNLESAQSAQGQRKSSDEEPAYLESKDIASIVTAKKNYVPHLTGDNEALIPIHEELIYVEVVDSKPVKPLGKSDSAINYNHSNAPQNNILNLTGDKKARSVVDDKPVTDSVNDSEINYNRTPNKGLIPNQTGDRKALQNTFTPKPFFLSKDSLLGEIGKRKMNRKENTSSQGETNTPRATRNVASNFPNKQPVKSPKKKLPRVITPHSTPNSDNMLEELPSLQANMSKNEQQNSTDEVYEWTTPFNSDFPLSVSPDSVLSSSPVETNALCQDIYPG